MEEQKKTKGSLALNAAPRLIAIPATERAETRKLRGAACWHVSSGSQDQFNSFAAQNSHYIALIHGKPDWELVEIYAGLDIIGTSADKRSVWVFRKFAAESPAHT